MKPQAMKEIKAAYVRLVDIITRQKEVGMKKWLL